MVRVQQGSAIVRCHKEFRGLGWVEASTLPQCTGRQPSREISTGEELTLPCLCRTGQAPHALWDMPEYQPCIRAMPASTTALAGSSYQQEPAAVPKVGSASVPAASTPVAAMPASECRRAVYAVQQQREPEVHLCEVQVCAPMPLLQGKPPSGRLPKGPPSSSRPKVGRPFQAGQV